MRNLELIIMNFPLLFLIPSPGQAMSAEVLPWPIDIPVMDWDGDGEYLDDVKALANWLLGYGEESTKIIKEGIRVSRVYAGKVTYQVKDKTEDLVENAFQYIQDNLEDVPNDAKEVFMDMSSDLDLAVNYAYHKFLDKSQIIAFAVKNIYNSMSSDDVNYRFHVILDEIIPDFSILYKFCPTNCVACSEKSSQVLCRLCCPDMFPEPITFTSLAMESRYTAMVTNWLQSSLRWTGLHAVYQNWIQSNSREQLDASNKEVKAFIRNFNWLHSVMKGEKITTRLEEVGNIDKEDSGAMLPEQVCGYFESEGKRRPQGRIMGGAQVERTRHYPWQVSLATGYMRMFYQHRCGAALISTRWALTAAHCMHTLGSQSLYIMGGFLDINDRETAQIREVEIFFNHENFVSKLYEQDISLLRLESPVVYTPSLLPVCLPLPTYSTTLGYSSHQGNTAILTGWGRQWDEGPLSSQLEMVELPVISNTECMDWYNQSGSRQFIPEHTFLCAGWENGARDACSGDSGGPLIVNREDGRAEVIGLVSWGIGCGVKGRPGVYTRVSQFVPWIAKKIKDYEARNLSISTQ